MRILVVAGWMHPDAEGGSFRVVYEVGRRLAARRHVVHVLTQRTQPSLPLAENVEGMAVHRYEVSAPAGPRFYLSAVAAVRRLARELHREVGLEVVHTHHPVSAYAVATCRALRGVPLVAVAHSLYHLEYLDRAGYDPRTGRERRVGLWRRLVALGLKRLDAVVFRRAARVIVLSEFMRGLVAEYHAEAAPKVVVAPGGADLAEFRPEPGRDDARAALGLPVERPVFFTCRRLEHRMGLRELVEAADLLRRRGREFVVIIAGRGSLEDQLRHTIEALGLDEVVRLVGYVAEEDLRVYYRAADCVVMPTRALEGFGLVSAEALACGRPVLGTAVGATPELLRGLDERLIVPEATPECLAAGMERFLDELRQEPDLEARCRAYAEANFDWERFVECVERASREVVGG